MISRIVFNMSRGELTAVILTGYFGGIILTGAGLVALGYKTGRRSR